MATAGDRESLSLRAWLTILLLIAALLGVQVSDVRLDDEPLPEECSTPQAVPTDLDGATSTVVGLCDGEDRGVNVAH